MAWLCDTRELYPDKVHARGRWAREVLRRHGQARLFGKWVEPIVRLLIKGIRRTQLQSFQDLTKSRLLDPRPLKCPSGKKLIRWNRL